MPVLTGAFAATIFGLALAYTVDKAWYKMVVSLAFWAGGHNEVGR
jgi:hypothetical protein